MRRHPEDLGPSSGTSSGYHAGGLARRDLSAVRPWGPRSLRGLDAIGSRAGSTNREGYRSGEDGVNKGGSPATSRDRYTRPRIESRDVSRAMMPASQVGIFEGKAVKIRRGRAAVMGRLGPPATPTEDATDAPLASGRPVGEPRVGRPARGSNSSVDDGRLF